MPRNQHPPSKFEKLRQLAEELIQKRLNVASEVPSDILELIHEVNIHQVELEIQNEELRRAQDELITLQQEFESLYEFAPCGYVTLNAKGIIKRANLTAVSLLEKTRHFLSGSKFSQYITTGWDDVYRTARQKTIESGQKESIELPLKNKCKAPLWVRVDIEADRDETGAVILWRIVLLDITERKQAEEKIHKLTETLEQRIAERTAELENRTNLLQQLALELSGAEDRERRHIASILHDDFQQQLAYIKIELELLSKNTDKILRNRLSRLAQLTGECIKKSRNLSYEINPPALHRNGLLSALGELAEDMENDRGLTITIRTQSDAEPTSLSLASILYRSTRELLLNVIRHSGMESAVLDVRNKNSLIYVRVEDNGNGFDYNAVRAMQGSGSGFGLFNIEDRMTFLGGSMKVKTKPGKGCCVELTVPQNVSLKATVPSSY